MHLWPSLRIRDAFSRSSIDKMERNLHRMEQERRRPSSSSAARGVAGSNPYKDPPDLESVSFLPFCGELLLLFSSFFCCGACDDEK